MTDTPKPTRSQLMDMASYIGPFMGAHYSHAEIKLREYEMDGPKQDGPSRVVGKVTERALAQHREAWIRDNWEDLVDHYVDDGFAVEDPEPLEERPCDEAFGYPGDKAHAPHTWDGERQESAGAAWFAITFQCPGVKAHRNTAIGGATTGRPADYGQIDVGTLTGGDDPEPPQQYFLSSGLPPKGPSDPVVMGGAVIGAGVERLNDATTVEGE